MIRIKPDQDVTKRKVGIFRVYNLFQSSVSHIILSVCVCACVHLCVCVHARVRGYVCIVNLSVSPIYFCSGSAF